MTLISSRHVPSCPNCGQRDSVWPIANTGRFFSEDWRASNRFKYSIFVYQEANQDYSKYSGENVESKNPMIYFCSYCYEIGYKLKKLKE